MNELLDTYSADESFVRHDLVTRVRRQMEMNLYEEDRRVDAILDRLMADLDEFRPPIAP